jgi:hypothetical protein
MNKPISVNGFLSTPDQLAINKAKRVTKLMQHKMAANKNNGPKRCAKIVTPNFLMHCKCKALGIKTVGWQEQMISLNFRFLLCQLSGILRALKDLESRLLALHK